MSHFEPISIQQQIQFVDRTLKQMHQVNEAYLKIQLMKNIRESLMELDQVKTVIQNGGQYNGHSFPKP